MLTTLVNFDSPGVDLTASVNFANSDLTLLQWLKSLAGFLVEEAFPVPVTENGVQCAETLMKIR